MVDDDDWSKALGSGIYTSLKEECVLMMMIGISIAPVREHLVLKGE